MSAAPAPPALELRELVVRYGRSRRARHEAPSVDEVSLSVAKGETVGLVGESGSGKSTIVKAVLGLQRVASGAVVLDGSDITHASARRRRDLAARLRVVFQDPYSSLSPFQTVGATILEPLRPQGLDAEEARARAAAAIGAVGLPADTLDRYPSQFSGGQRQRIALARALVSEPDVVLLDEPVSALDLSTQAQVLNLLAELGERRAYAFLFVAHDLGVVRFLCRRVAVMYRGRIVEVGPTPLVTEEPKHPYTIALTAAMPVPDVGDQARRRAARDAAAVEPGPSSPAGCSYAGRCPMETEICRSLRPELRSVGGRLVACHNATQ